MKSDNQSYANRRENFADVSPMQFALREIQRIAGDPKFWVGLAAITFILAVSAPFGTGDDLNFFQLLAYWGAICLTTYFPAAFVSMGVGFALSRVGVNEFLSWCLAGLAAAVPVVSIILAINIFIVKFSPSENTPLWLLVLQCAGISVAVVAVHFLLMPQRNQADDAEPDENVSSSNLVLDRLPPEKRGLIHHMTMQDHYIQVTTDGGTELILMRMADAVAALDGYPGIQIHRSHWVATAQVNESKRINGQPTLIMSDGTQLPVSRTYLPKVREVGLL